MMKKRMERMETSLSMVRLMLCSVPLSMESEAQRQMSLRRAMEIVARVKGRCWLRTGSGHSSVLWRSGRNARSPPKLAS
jgi:hypothetical protein